MQTSSASARPPGFHSLQSKILCRNMDHNPFSALGDSDDTMEDHRSLDSLDRDSSGSYPDNTQEGWEDEFGDLEGEDNSEDVRETEAAAEERRRKVSQGPPTSEHQPNLTLSFDPALTGDSPRMGRDGGIHIRSELQVGTLPVIPEGVSETTVTEQEGGPGTDLHGTMPPSLKEPERQKKTFLFRAQLTWGTGPRY
jgi:hypothetical protein